MDKKVIVILLGVCILTLIFRYADFSNSEKENVSKYEMPELANITNGKYNYKGKSKTQEIENKSKKTGLIELNTAEMKDLAAVLPKTDSIDILRVLSYRKFLRGFNSNDQLYLIPDLSEKTANQIKKVTFVEPIHDSIYVNIESFESLIQHPFLSKKQIDIILRIRDRKGKVSSIKRLGLLEEFKKKDLENLAPYLSFRTVNQ